MLWSCPTGGYPSIQHNEIRDLTAGFLKRVATNVSVKPHPQPLTGEHLHLCTAIQDDQARLDVAANGIWEGRFECTYVDVRVFNPFASSNLSSSVPSSYMYVQHEKLKKRAYEECLCKVEHATFVPAVFTTTGEMGKCASAFYNRIASLLAKKISEPYASTIAYIRCRLSFAVLRASVMRMRGSRSLCSARDEFSDSAMVAVAEANIRH